MEATKGPKLGCRATGKRNEISNTQSRTAGNRKSVVGEGGSLQLLAIKIRLFLDVMRSLDCDIFII
jgi:hypothetical protein